MLNYRRGQTFSIDILIALAIFALLFTSMERIQTEVAKDRTEWEIMYNLKMAADDIMTSLVDSTAETNSFGVSQYDGGMGFERLNLIDTGRISGLDVAGLNQMYLSRLATTTGGIGFGWQILLYVCKGENMGVKVNVSLPTATKWKIDLAHPRCVVTQTGVDNETTCQGPAANGTWDADTSECLLLSAMDEDACSAATVDVQWKEDPPNPRCIAYKVANSTSCAEVGNALWNGTTGECRVNSIGGIPIDDVHDCEHIRTVWKWNDPAVKPGGRCILRSVGMDEEFCDKNTRKGWDAGESECVFKVVTDRGSCELYCWDREYHQEESMDDRSSPSAVFGPATGIGYRRCSTDDGCIAPARARYGIVSVNRVVATPSGGGVGFVNLEVWK